jgi:ankyrin repeat protein
MNYLFLFSFSISFHSGHALPFLLIMSIPPRKTTAGHVEACEALLELGADVSASAKDGSCPLHCAAMYGHAAVVSVLVGRGAATEVYYETHMHCALFFPSIFRC